MSTRSDALNSILLLGMPGSGKSTLGRLLADRLRMPFVDTDDLLRRRLGSSLQEFLDTQGYLALRAEEERAVLDAKLSSCVIASGGSLVYANTAMEALLRHAHPVYLSLSLNALHQRIGDFKTRGIASAVGSTLEDIFSDRDPRYRRYAASILDCNNKSVKECLSELFKLCSSHLDFVP